MNKKGFTMVEVALFLAITGLLFVGIAVGVQNSIFQQRINDSVQNFAEFLRNAYSEVTNVQSISRGNTDKAIYGKLITFGEEKGEEYEFSKIYSYSVIGKADGATTGSTLVVLQSLNANIITVGSGGIIKPINITESYTPRWASSIEPACDENSDTCSYEPFEGALLIVRHPKSGVIYTYVSNKAIKVGDEIERLNEIGRNQSTGETDEINVPNILFMGDPGEDGNYGFEIKQVDFCINSDPGVENTMRRDVRVIKDARNASGVEIVSDAESKCNKEK